MWHILIAVHDASCKCVTSFIASRAPGPPIPTPPAANESFGALLSRHENCPVIHRRHSANPAAGHSLSVMTAGCVISHAMPCHALFDPASPAVPSINKNQRVPSPIPSHSLLNRIKHNQQTQQLEYQTRLPIHISVFSIIF